jgi:UDP-glucose 4-epimerase
MRCLLTGANGFVGKALGDELARSGHLVRAATRSALTAQATMEQVLVGALDSTTSWAEALREVDAVVHLAACM